MKVELLKKYHPYLKNITNKLIPVELTKNNNYTLKYKNIYLHSKYNPVVEANKIIHSYKFQNNSIVILLGLGLGYILKELTENHPNNYYVVYEKEHTIFRTFIEYAEPNLLKNNKIIFLINNDINKIEEILYYLINIKHSESRITIIPHQPSFKIEPQYYNKIQEQILDIKANIYSNYLTVKKFAFLWETNIKKNIKVFESSNRLSELKNKYHNKSGIIVGAGPTLNENLTILKENKDAVIISVDTAFRVLIKNHIYPDFVISLDAKFENLYDFKNIDTEHTSLVFDITTFPKIPLLFKKRYTAYTYRLVNDLNDNSIVYYDTPIEGILKKYGDFGGLQSGGSVATNAFDFALFLGIKNITLIGIDLKYINFKSHCKGAYIDDYFLLRSNKLYNFETFNFTNVINRKITARKIINKSIYHYDFILNKYNQWFKDAIKKLNIKVVWK